MMVKVFNDNIYPYAEKYKGNQINIPAKGFIEMDHNEASHFLGVMPPNIEVDANGIQKPTSYKMLRIDVGQGKPVEAPKTYICHACNKDLHTKKAYDAHIEEKHMDELVDEEAKDKIAKKRGRPAKEVTNDASHNRNSG